MSRVRLMTVLFALFLAVTPVRPQATADRTQQIAELEKQLTDLNKKLADLKAPTASTAKRPVTLADAVSWKGLRGVSLSNDGQWVACRIAPAEGEGEVILRQTRGDKEYKFPGGSGAGALSFSDDGKWLAFLISPRRQGPPVLPTPGQRPPPPPPAKVALVNVTTGEKTEVEGVRRFAFSGESAGWVAFHKAPPAPPTSGASRTGPATPPTPAERSIGTDLIVRELATGTDLTLGNVSEFGFDKAGRRLALVIETQGQVGNGVQLRDLKSGVLTQLDSGKAAYEKLTWTEKGDGLTVLKGVEDATRTKVWSLIGFKGFDASPSQKIAYDPQGDPAFPKGLTVSTSRAATFSDDLATIFFGIAEPRKPEDKPAERPTADRPTPESKPAVAAEGKSSDKSDLILWHWADERLQPQQQVQANSDREFTYLCAYHVGTKKFVRLADPALKNVSLAANQKWAVGLDARAYQRRGSLDGRRYQDVQVIDVATGTRRPALSKSRWFLNTSPAGTHFLYYEDGHFHAWDMATGKSVNLTQGAPVSFVDVEDDHNVDRPPCRSIGWSKDGTFVLLSDNWDVWQFPVTGGPGLNLTVDGKAKGLRYRQHIVLDPDEKGIDLSKPVYFSVFEELTKKSGFARLDPGKPGLSRLLWEDADLGGLARAKNADTFTYVRQTFRECPDLYATDATFKVAKKLTTLGQQTEKFTWSPGTRLIYYTSTKGDKLQAALYLPAGYEKGKSYPTIVYIYEHLSDNLHRFVTPAAGGSGFNAAIYTSNGYAVLNPDINYQINDPGKSAVACVLPALDAAVATGIVDKARVGLQGHSWGGYQTSFLITQTDAFKAAVAGAPLTDLVSMYSSIYWNTGSANQPIFESSQGRFTGSYTDEMEAYVRNSPVHHAKNVKTPLIIMHNDKDGAVDFTQGIEYFNTLRRLDKPVIMLQYKGENHGLVKPANQKDYAVRMREFFDHHLTGKEAPAWLKEGVPHLKMDEHLTERSKDR